MFAGDLATPIGVKDLRRIEAPGILGRLDAERGIPRWSASAIPEFAGVPPDRGRSVRTSQWHPMMRDDPVAVRSTGHPAQCIDRGKPSEATPCSRGRSHERRAERRLPACGARAISGVLCVQRDRQQTRSQWRRLATAPGQPARRPAIAWKQPRRRRQDARSHAQIHTAPGGGGACTRHRPRCTPRAAGSA